MAAIPWCDELVLATNILVAALNGSPPVVERLNRLPPRVEVAFRR